MHESRDITTVDVWAASGFNAIDPNSMPEVVPIPSQEEVDQATLFRQRLREYNLGKESVTKARLAVTLDSVAILGIEAQLDEFTEPEGWHYDTDEEKALQKQARHEQLMGTIRAMAALPEQLSFEAGITLIVGDNGLGKSTLAKAMIYAARIADDLRDPKLRTGEFPSYEEAKEDVLSPSASSEDEVTELYQAGLAPIIAEHIKVDELAHGAPGFRYYDIASEFGRANEMSKRMGRSQYGYDSNGHSMRSESSHDRRGRSHRQSVDLLMEQTIGRDKREHERYKAREKSPEAKAHYAEFGPIPDSGAPQVLAIDEPETGMSVKRHLDIVNYLTELVPNGSAVIVPTNSVVLYQSDLPRIDLEHPERGIHRPSEYPN